MKTKSVNKSLVEFFDQGHFDVRMPEGEIDDYDSAVPDYVSLYLLDHGACEDSNGSEALHNSIIEDLDSSFWITFIIYSRVYERATWPNNVELKCHGKIVDEVFEVDKVSYPQEMDYL